MSNIKVFTSVLRKSAVHVIMPFYIVSIRKLVCINDKTRLDFSLDTCQLPKILKHEMKIQNET